MWDDTQFYGIDPEQLDEVEAIAPLIGIRVDDRPVTEPLARIAEFAESLGADPDGRDRRGQGHVRHASEEFPPPTRPSPTCSSAAVSGSATEMYVAYPPKWPDLSYYQELGHEPGRARGPPHGGWVLGDPELGGGGKYPVDLVMADGRGGIAREHPMQIPAVAMSCRRIDADQIVIWPAVHAYGYGYFADHPR